MCRAPSVRGPYTPDLLLLVGDSCMRGDQRREHHHQGHDFDTAHNPSFLSETEERMFGAVLVLQIARKSISTYAGIWF